MNLPFYLSQFKTSEINTGELIDTINETNMTRKLSAKIKHKNIIIQRKVVTLSV